MDTMTRNHIFMENIDLINRTLRRHRLLLYALHLELDDVYQELAIAALQAIDTYDDRRCDSITVHIWAKLQYAVLTIKRRNKPHGIMACEGFAPGVLSLELSEDYGYDCLRAIAFELNLGLPFEKAIQDLNIINLHEECYNVTLHFHGGRTMTAKRCQLDLFGDDRPERVCLQDEHGRDLLIVEFDPQMCVYDYERHATIVPAEALSWTTLIITRRKRWRRLRNWCRTIFR